MPKVTDIFHGANLRGRYVWFDGGRVRLDLSTLAGPEIGLSLLWYPKMIFYHQKQFLLLTKRSSNITFNILGTDVQYIASKISKLLANGNSP